MYDNGEEQKCSTRLLANNCRFLVLVLEAEGSFKIEGIKIEEQSRALGSARASGNGKEYR